MRERGVGGLWDQFRDALPPPGPSVVTDGDLLARFVAARDEDAFRILVRRHGPMVWAVSRRILRDSHAAEDAFQATFLVLARHAKSIRQRETLTAWLHRVAVRVALRAKNTRRADASTLAEIPDKTTSVEERELRGILDAAIERLPDKLRRTVVLCYLSGHTTEEAARVLECPKGTVLSRLSAARDKLKADLTRRGITISIGALSAALTAESAPATVPSALVALTANLALPTAVIAPAVLLLAKGVMAMTWTKITLATVLMLGVGTGIGIGTAGPKQVPDKLPLANKSQEKATVDRVKDPDTVFDTFSTLISRRDQAGDSQLKKLMTERVNAAANEINERMKEFLAGRGTLDIVLDAARRGTDASLELAGSDQSRRLVVCQGYAEITRSIYELNQQRFIVGAMKRQELEQSRFHFVDAQIRALREQGVKE